MGTAVGSGRESWRARYGIAGVVGGLILSLGCGGLAGAPDVAAPLPPTPGEPPAAAPPAVDTPNVLFIVADDLGTDKVAAYREHPKPPQTPRIDALAAEGVLFDNAYAYATCSPTRAALLTGRYGRRNGFGGIVSLDVTEYELPLEEVTIPEMLNLSASTWESAALGKWHLSGHKTSSAFSHPNEQGFGHYAGCLGNLVLTDTRGKRGSYYDFEKAVNGEVSFEKQYATSDTTDDAIEQMRRLRSPWFLYVAYNAPHEPAHVPPAELVHTPVTESSSEADKIDAAIEALDTELGRLLDSMTPKQRRETLVVFVGDNGTARDGVREPFDPEHAKTTLYEGGTNVPLIVRGPGVAEGKRTRALAHVVDLYPTIAQVAGVDLSRITRQGTPVAIDGVSLMDVLASPDSTGPRSFVYTEKFRPIGMGPYDVDWKAIRDDRYKLLDVGKRRLSFFDLEGRFDDGPPLRPAQLTPVEKERYDALLAELDRIETGVTGEY